MKHISEIDYKTQEIKPRTHSDKNTPAVLELFKRFEAIYGQVWLNRYGSDEDFQLLLYEWSDSISQLSLDEIMRRADYCKQNHDFPPSIAQFVSIGNPGKEFGLDYVPAYYHKSSRPKIKFLPNPNTDKAKEKAIQECRKILKTARVS